MKKIAVNVIVIIIALMITEACSKRRSEFETVLVQRNNCWIYYDDPEKQLGNNEVYAKSCTNFLIDGTCHDFLFKDDDTLTELKSLDEYSDLSKWRYSEKDSLFEIDEIKFKIVRYNTDTIVFKTASNNIQTLVRKF